MCTTHTNNIYLMADAVVDVAVVGREGGREGGYRGPTSPSSSLMGSGESGSFS